MNKKIKTITIINYIINGIFWLLGILFLLFNFLGLWKLWNYAGYSLILYVPVTIPFLIISLIMSIKGNEKKFLTLNIIAIVLSIFFFILSITVSQSWFW